MKLTPPLLVHLVVVCFISASSVQAKRWESFQLAFDLLSQKKSSLAKDPFTTTAGISLIGAGFSRTGTKSIDKALRGLGYKIYDTVSMMEHSHEKRLTDALRDWKNKGDTSKIQTLLQEIESLGYTATLDSPINLFASAFAQLRPDAKVLLSVRDNADKWVDSTETSSKFTNNFYLRPWVWLGISEKIDDIIEMWNIAAGGTLPTIPKTYPQHKSRPLPWYEYMHTKHTTSNFSPVRRRLTKELYSNHTQDLQDTIHPSERLLIFNVKQGWDPLVSFLGLDPKVAERPFPNVNDSGALIMVSWAMHILGAGAPLWILLILWVTWRMVQFIVSIGAKMFKSKTTKVE